MAFGSFSGEGPPQPMAEINVTPLVDVMLVLLVIFIITAPLLGAAIRLDLPNEKAAPAESRATSITLSIDADGSIYWDRDRVDDASLRTRLAEAAKSAAPAEVQLRADKATRYERIAFVMAAAQQAGIKRIGFVTEPRDTAAEPAGAGSGK
jgi:biopolymer transport protein ExbD